MQLVKNHDFSVIIVSRRLGHARTWITSDVHGHLIPGMQIEVARISSNLITPVKLQPTLTHKTKMQQKMIGDPLDLKI